MRQFLFPAQCPIPALVLSVSLLLMACAETSVDRTAWIEVGKTTQAEVVKQ